jgi:hypothetical protein
LLLALTLQLIATPFLDRVVGKDIFSGVLSTVVLGAAIYASGFSRKQLGAALVLATLATVGIWYVIWIEPNYVVAGLSVIGNLAFNVFVVVLILAKLFRTRDVTANTIYGSISVYMLLCFSFAILYIFMETFSPGSFFLDLSRDIDNRLDYPDLLYFSFTTQTTLGFGDVTPVSPHARSATSVQVIIGVFYLAVLISRFVSMFVARSLESVPRELTSLEKAHGD